MNEEIRKAVEYHHNNGDMDGHVCLLNGCALHYPKTTTHLISKTLPNGRAFQEIDWAPGTEIQVRDFVGDELFTVRGEPVGLFELSRGKWSKKHKSNKQWLQLHIGSKYMENRPILSQSDSVIRAGLHQWRVGVAL